MNKSSAQKVALVTGGGSGICMGITKQFLQLGVKCAITSRNMDKLEAAAQTLRDQVPGASVLPVKSDVRDPVSLELAVRQTVEAYGRIDILICGAAGNFLQTAEKLTANAFGTVVDIDLKVERSSNIQQGTFNTIKAALPELKKTRGNIISLSATLHHNGTPLQAHAVAAKAGIDAMTKTLAVEWVNCIAPGPISDTEGFRKLAPPGSNKDAVPTFIPLKRFGVVKDIADAAVFLADASYITGAVLVVDGGASLGGDEPFRTAFRSRL